MASSRSVRVLIVAHRTAATPLLLNAVRARAGRSRCSFTLLVPRPYWDPDTDEAGATLELAIPLLEEAAGGHVDGIIGDTDPFVAVRETVTKLGIDEIIVSTLPARVSHWLRRDLPHRVEQFGLPVTVVTAQQSERAVSERGESTSPSWVEAEPACPRRAGASGLSGLSSALPTRDHASGARPWGQRRARSRTLLLSLWMQ